MRVLIYTLFIIIFICSCHQANKPIEKKTESKEAKTLLQGIWLDEESGNVIFMIKGDSIFYPDTTSMPTDFRIVNDTMLIGHSDVKYSIEKQMPNVFWFKNQNGDVIKLMKSNDAIDSLAFEHKKPEVLFDVSWIIIFGTVGAFLSFNAGLKNLTPEEASITVTTEPAASVIISWAIFGTKFGLIESFGIILVLLAIIMPSIIKK